MSTQDDLKEQLAAIEHERWADWQRWVHDVYYKKGRPFEVAIKRWEVQIKTPYAQLSEAEKQSDRDQVERYWPLIENLITKARLEELQKTYDDTTTGNVYLALGKITERIAHLKKTIREGE
jgi:hypothetical protein